MCHFWATSELAACTSKQNLSWCSAGSLLQGHKPRLALAACTDAWASCVLVWAADHGHHRSLCSMLLPHVHLPFSQLPVKHKAHLGSCQLTVQLDVALVQADHAVDKVLRPAGAALLSL